MGNIIGKSGTIVVILLVVVLIGVLFMPQIRQWMLNLRADEITIVDPAGQRAGSIDGTLDLKIVSILGRDGIPAILNPIFVPASQAVLQMVPGERVIGVSINGDHRAYSLNLLSRHEIVNDTVGGVPVAVTW